MRHSVFQVILLVQVGKVTGQAPSVKSDYKRLELFHTLHVVTLIHNPHVVKYIIIDSDYLKTFTESGQCTVVVAV